MTPREEKFARLTIEDIEQCADEIRRQKAMFTNPYITILPRHIATLPFERKANWIDENTEPGLKRASAYSAMLNGRYGIGCVGA